MVRFAAPLAFVVLAACAQGAMDSSAPGGLGGASSVATGSASSGSCNDGLTVCDATCVDTASDPAHCGGCNQACGDGVACVGGQCAGGASTSTASSASMSSASASSSKAASATSSSVASSSVAASSSSGGGGNCNPLSPKPGCGAGKHCKPTENGTPLCEGPVGFGTQYSSCSSSADCADVYECVNTPFNTVYCMKWCKTDNDCGLGDFCNTLDPPLYVGATEWGVCYDGFP